MKKKLVRVVTSDVTFGLVKGQLKFLSNSFNVIAVSSPGKRLNTIPLTEGVKTKAIKIDRRISPFNDVKALYKLYKFFKQESPDIVHSMTPKAGLLSMAAAYLAKTPVRIHTFTGLIFPTKKGVFQKLLIAMDKVLCLCATTIIPEGLGVKQDLINYGVTTKPLSLIANGNINGVDIDYFKSTIFSERDKLRLKKRLNINEKDYVFIFAGRLVGDKGINELTDAFVKINKQNKNTKLILLGVCESKLDPLEETTVHVLENHDNILTLGWRQDIRSYFAISDSMVFPSYREGFPNVILQACAMQLPCIVSNINGCNEIITNNSNGFVVPAKNKNALYKSMMQMCSMSKETHKKMGHASRHLIVEKFEKHFVWNSLLLKYNSLVKT